MLGELMSPEVGVWCALIDPVGVHPVEQIILLEAFNESCNRWAFVCRHDGTVRETIGGVG